jgi:hypothetical protein
MATRIITTPQIAARDRRAATANAVILQSLPSDWGRHIRTAKPSARPGGLGVATQETIRLLGGPS